MIDQIGIAMRKITSNSLNTGKLSNNFKGMVQQFIAQYKTYSFMYQRQTSILEKKRYLKF